jgi:hypothetical protein
MQFTPSFVILQPNFFNYMGIDFSVKNEKKHILGRALVIVLYMNIIEVEVNNDQVVLSTIQSYHPRLTSNAFY